MLIIDLFPRLSLKTHLYILLLYINVNDNIRTPLRSRSVFISIVTNQQSTSP